MTRDEIITILKILKTAYPRFYNNMSKNEAEDTINLWLDMFRNERPDLVIGAVKNLINHFSYPPTIADIKNEIFNALDVKGITSTEAWNLTRAAIRKSAYDSKEEFAKLPKEAQRIVGAPSQLKQWAISTDFNESVVKGQFLKQFEQLKNRDRQEQQMLPEYENIINQLIENTDKKFLGEGNET